MPFHHVVLVLRLGATEYMVSEGGGSVGIRVVKEGNAEQPVTATLTTSDGAAVGEDLASFQMKDSEA